MGELTGIRCIGPPPTFLCGFWQHWT